MAECFPGRASCHTWFLNVSAEDAEDLADACIKNTEVTTEHQTYLMKSDPLNLDKQMLEYDATHNNDPIYQRERMHMVLLQFQRATQQGN